REPGRGGSLSARFGLGGTRGHAGSLPRLGQFTKSVTRRRRAAPPGCKEGPHESRSLVGPGGAALRKCSGTSEVWFGHRAVSAPSVSHELLYHAFGQDWLPVGLAQSAA